MQCKEFKKCETHHVIPINARNHRCIIRASCLLQSTAIFPWEFSEVIADLLVKLEYIKDCFSQGIVPDLNHQAYSDIDYHPNGLHKQPWSVMKSHLP